MTGAPSEFSDEVAELLRRSLLLSRSRDLEGLETALSAATEDQLRSLLGLTVLVDRSLIDRNRPAGTDGGEDDALRESFVAGTNWCELGNLPVGEVFDLLVRPGGPMHVDGDAALVTAVLLGGWLLSQHVPEGMGAAQYLDDVLIDTTRRPLARQVTEVSSGTAAGLDP